MANLDTLLVNPAIHMIVNIILIVIALVLAPIRIPIVFVWFQPLRRILPFCSPYFVTP
jgi:type IV secretory pathway VirB6-like protein